MLYQEYYINIMSRRYWFALRLNIMFKKKKQAIIIIIILQV